MAPCLADREIYTKFYQYIHLPFDTTLLSRHAGCQLQSPETPTAKSLTNILQRFRSAPKAHLFEVWLKTWKLFYSDGKCPLDGTWCQNNNCTYQRELPDYDVALCTLTKFSPDPTWLRMPTAPFHGTFSPLEVHSVGWHKGTLLQSGPVIASVMVCYKHTALNEVVQIATGHTVNSQKVYHTTQGSFGVLGGIWGGIERTMSGPQCAIFTISSMPGTFPSFVNLNLVFRYL